MSTALGGYILSSYAEDTLCKTDAAGIMSDDVVGERPDKAVCSSGPLHLGGLYTDCYG